MLEQAFQTLEGIFGPLLEAILCEYLTMGPQQQWREAASVEPPQGMAAAASAFAAAATAAAAGTRNVPPPPFPGSPASRGMPAASPQVTPGRGLQEALAQLGLPQPPQSASACADLLLGNEWLRLAKFPVTIRKRLETVSAVSGTLLAA